MVVTMSKVEQQRQRSGVEARSALAPARQVEAQPDVAAQLQPLVQADGPGPVVLAEKIVHAADIRLQSPCGSRIDERAQRGAGAELVALVEVRMHAQAGIEERVERGAAARRPGETRAALDVRRKR